MIDLPQYPLPAKTGPHCLAWSKGRCQFGHFHGMRDEGFCIERCIHPGGVPVAGSIVSRLASAAVGVGKVALGLDKAGEAVEAARMAVCAGCEHLTPCLMDQASCCGRLMDVLRPTKPTCGCIVERGGHPAGKLKMASAKCPLGKW